MASFFGFLGQLVTIQDRTVIEVNKIRRTVVEVRHDLHKEIRKLALLNDLRIHELTNAILEEYLRDPEKVTALVRRLQL